jgi:hypothetical protein
MGHNTKYPREHVIAQSNAAIRTNKIEKKQDLFISRIQALQLRHQYLGLTVRPLEVHVE